MRNLKTKAIALILVLLTILPALSSCGSVDYEALVKDAMIYINPYEMICEDEMDINAAINAESEEVFGEHYKARYFYLPARSEWYERGYFMSNSSPEAEAFFAEGKQLTFGNKTFLVGSSDFTGAQATKTHYTKRTIYHGAVMDSDEQKVRIYVTDDGQLYGVNYIVNSLNESVTEIGIDKALQKAVTVINDEIVNEYGLDIDFTQYKFIASSKNDYYYLFAWEKIVNGHKLNHLIVHISFDGEAYDFYLEDNFVENLESNPLLTLDEKEIEKYLFPMVQEKLSDLTAKGYDIVFDHVYTPAYRYGDLSVFYFRTVEKYMLYVQIEYRLVNKEKNIDYPKSASILIPIQE